MAKKEIIENPAFYAIFLFVGFYFLIIHGFPGLLFEEDGSIRQFGIGFKKKTIFPIWMFAIILGILCYMAVQAYKIQPKVFI